MAKRLFFTDGLTFAPQTIGSAATTLQFMSIKIPSGGAAAALCDLLEVLVSGTASASTIGGFALSRASTLSTGAGSALASPNSDGPMLPSASALAAANVIITAINYATTQPTISSAGTDARLNLGLNSFGGILRWNAAPTQQWQLAGVSAPGAETVLANLSAGGAQSTTSNAHIMYEPY